MDIKELFKNPIIAFFAGLLVLWAMFKLLKIFLGLFWLFAIAFIVLYFVNDRFRHTVRTFFTALFNK